MIHKCVQKRRFTRKGTKLILLLGFEGIVETMKVNL